MNALVDTIKIIEINMKEATYTMAQLGTSKGHLIDITYLCSFC